MRHAETQAFTPERRTVIDAAIALAVGDVFDEGAFDSLVAAVKRHLRQEGALPEAARRAPLVTFGEYRDLPVDRVPTTALEELSHYLQRAIKSPAKASWRAENYALLAVVRNELKRRDAAEEVSSCL